MEPNQTQSHWIESDPAAQVEKKINSNLIAPICRFPQFNNNNNNNVILECIKL